MNNFRFLFLIACAIIVWQLPSQAQTTKIGNQEWTASNLDVSHFRNGDPIFEAKTNEEWKKAGEEKKPACCYYENKTENGTIYGKLYNWYAVNDARGLAPEGWRIPSKEDWDVLIKFVGSTGMVGKKLKSATYWKSPNAGATNDYNFSFLPGGQRHPLGNFIQLGELGAFWTTTVGGLTNSAYSPTFDNATSTAIAYDQSKSSGRAVRCVRDKTEEIKAVFNAISVKIGNQEWTASNLDVSHFRNGDPIFEAKTNEEWKKAGEEKKPACCYYENKTENGAIYGKLYNWYAANDARGLAPEGWRIPSKEDWDMLIKFVASTGMVGKKLKSPTYWKSPNAGATNDYNFSFLPGGQRHPLGNFIQLGESGAFWTITVGGLTNSAYSPTFDNATSTAVGYDQSQCSGRSVRCIKNK